MPSLSRIVPIALCALFGLAAAGCLKISDDITLNPDGSGKVHHVAEFQTMKLFDDGTESEPEEDMKDAVREELARAEGVDAWTDVSFELTDSGMIRFAGTAYFKNLQDVAFHNGGMDIDLLETRLTREDGGMTVVLGPDEQAVPENEKPVDIEDIDAELRKSRAQFQQQRPVLVAMLSTLDIERRFTLPGKVVEKNNVIRFGDGKLGARIKGSDVIDMFDTLTADDNWLKEIIESGRELAGEETDMDERMQEALYGSPGPVSVTVESGAEPLFDYEAEVAAARSAYPDMLKALGLAGAGAAAGPVMPIPAAEGEGLTGLRVGGVRIIHFEDRDNDVRPFNHDKSYTLSLVGTFAGSVLEVSEGLVKTAIADNGDDLRPEREWDQRIHFARLSDDSTAVIFEVKLENPAEGVSGIREITGELTYLVAGGTETVDLGIVTFEKGAAGDLLGATVTEIKDTTWGDKGEELSLKLKMDPSGLDALVFHDSEGRELETKRTSTMSSGNQVTITHRIDGAFPDEGGVKAVLFKDLEKYEIPFELRDVDLLGNPR